MSDSKLGNSLRDILPCLASAMYEHTWLCAAAALTGKLLHYALELLGLCHNWRTHHNQIAALTGRELITDPYAYRLIGGKLNSVDYNKLCT